MDGEIAWERKRGDVLQVQRIADGIENPKKEQWQGWKALLSL